MNIIFKILSRVSRLVTFGGEFTTKTHLAKQTLLDLNINAVVLDYPTLDYPNTWLSKQF